MGPTYDDLTWMEKAEMHHNWMRRNLGLAQENRKAYVQVVRGVTDDGVPLLAQGQVNKDVAKSLMDSYLLEASMNEQAAVFCLRRAEMEWLELEQGMKYLDRMKEELPPDMWPDEPMTIQRFREEAHDEAGLEGVAESGPEEGTGTVDAETSQASE